MDPEAQAQIDTIRAETIASVVVQYEALDTNGDGSVDREELIAIARAQGGSHNVDEAQLAEFFTQFDANNDGKVSKDEWINFFGKMFDEAMAPIIAAAAAAQ